MKPIKFRVWDALRETFIFYEIIRGEVVIEESKKWMDITAIDAVHEQYIGIIDEKGVDIYENDYVSGLFLYNGVETIGLFRVKYENGCVLPFGMLARASANNFTVVGNLNEHPSVEQSVDRRFDHA